MTTPPCQLLTLRVQLVGESKQFSCGVDRGSGGGEGRGGHHNVTPEEVGLEWRVFEGQLWLW